MRRDVTPGKRFPVISSDFHHLCSDFHPSRLMEITGPSPGGPPDGSRPWAEASPRPRRGILEGCVTSRLGSV